MADRFWKSVPAAFRKPALDELYKRLRDLDYTQVDEGLVVLLKAILQLEAQGECRESATEAVLMVGYTSDGISNQEQTRWLSWNVDGDVRGFDPVMSPGLGNTTEYGAGEFPLPTRPPAGAGSQSTIKTPSMFRLQQTEKSYPDLSSMKRELEMAQTEWDRANLDRDQAALDRDQAKLDRDQAILERDKAILDRDLLMAEREQEQRLQENVANCCQIKSELERLQRRQQVVASGKEKMKTTTEPVVTRSRPESRMEVDEVTRSSGRFKLDRVAQEHMNEGFEAWTPPEPVPSVRNLEANRIRPLMNIALPGLTSSSTCGSQSGTVASRLRELQENLQAKTPKNAAREQRPTNSRDHLVRSVVVSSYKKNTNGMQHRHN